MTRVCLSLEIFLILSNHRLTVVWLLYLEMADSVIRTNPSSDYTNGFFVACFLRKDTVTDTANENKRKLEQGDANVAPSNKKSKKKNKKKKTKSTVDSSNL
jgi:hypothetical protein